MTDQDDLSISLYRLSEDILDVLEQRDDIEPMEVQTSRRVVNLEYSPSSHSMQTSSESVETLAWPPQILNTITEYIEESDNYRDTIEALSERTERPPEMALKQYIRALLSQKLDGIGEPEIVRLITIFSAQIEDAPINWHPIIFLTGVKLSTESIDLCTGTTLRQPKGEDLEYENSISGIDRSLFDKTNPIIRQQFPVIPGSVLEFSERAADSTDITRIVDQHVILLQLYDVGSIEIIEREYNPEAILKGQSQPGDPPTSPFSAFGYTIDSDEIPSLNEFFDALADIVLEQLVDIETDTTLTIAYDRYENALSSHSSKDQHLTSAIMCLEALLLREKERGELSERLSRRAGILLNQFGYEPIKVSRKLSKAYQIRSQYVHGTKLNEEDNIAPLTDDVMEYSRRCLVLFLQVTQDIEKEDLLSKVDNASLHPNARDKVEQVLDESCEVL